MIVTRYLNVRHAETWEIDPNQLPGWDGTEEDLAAFDWEILKVGTYLSEETYPHDHDSELDYTIESGAPDPAESEPWIDPDVMAS